MEDQFTQRAGSNLLDKSLELVEELILILLNLPANNREQYHLLNTYADYVREGGELKAVQFDALGLEDFHSAAKGMGLSYYSAVNKNLNEATVIIKECDEALLDEVLNKCPYLPPRKTTVEDLKEMAEENAKAKEQKKTIQEEHVNGKDTQNGRSK